jgi:7-carboxy-7-deazaguanine synthase
MDGRINVAETFLSIQGESTYAGSVCFFVRFAGCNLRCRYCDTTEAWTGGESVAVDDLVRMACASRAPVAEITGGEPLLQPAFRDLVRLLRERFTGTILVETNGSLDISAIPSGVVAIVDFKCPGSGETDANDWDNVGRLRPCDEVKFVLTCRADYDWAVAQVRKHGLEKRCCAVLFSTVPGSLDAADLAAWLCEDRLPVRLQVQLHKVLGLK